ncbi:MAG: hypothetical protein U0Y08_02350 [Bacteroidia bacterium]
MKLNLKYYCTANGRYSRPEGELILKNRRVISNGIDVDTDGKPRKFFFDETDMNIMFESDVRKSKIHINGIITESEYSSSQREYLVQLSWMQRQKLNWMFRRHWLQQPTNFFHLMVVVFLFIILIVTIDFLTGHL